MKQMTKTEYNTIHQWLKRHYKKTGKCQHCKAIKKTQWANKNGIYDKHNIKEWLELCQKCHTHYDKSHPLMRIGYKKCTYCRSRYNKINIFREERYTSLTFKPLKPKEYKLCDSCYRHEIGTQIIYRHMLRGVLPI